MDFLRVLPQDAVEKTNGKSGVQLRIIVTRLQLPGIDFAPVKHDSLDQSAKNRQLHFDIVDRSGLIDCFDVENR